MDNITHALAGVAMAECALPHAAAHSTRKVFMVAAVVAASAPDVDLAYTWIVESPLGYLLHHRGHSHTLLGLFVLGAAILGACRLWPVARRTSSELRWRFHLMLAAALMSHLLLDAANVYGTHLLHPLTARWYYGDAVFIFEPWLWLVLGVAAARNASGPWSRRLLWSLNVVLPLALLAAGLIRPGVLLLLALAGAALWASLAKSVPKIRATVALAGTAIVLVGFLGASPLAKAAAIDAIRAADGAQVIDVAANPNPAVPWCWSVVTIERTFDDMSLVVRRGTVSLLPALVPPETCVSHRLLSTARPPGLPEGTGAVRWNREWQVDLAGLRSLAATDCRVAAWLQFGRVPFIERGHIVDLRFDNPIGGNFSAMAIGGDGPTACPSNLTRWEWPRADVLDVE